MMAPGYVYSGVDFVEEGTGPWRSYGKVFISQPGPDREVRSMKYHIRQRAWTLREQFIVKDQSGNPAFRIKSRFFHIGDHLIIRDHQTHEKVARIKQHVFF